MYSIQHIDDLIFLLPPAPTYWQVQAQFAILEKHMFGVFYFSARDHLERALCSFFKREYFTCMWFCVCWHFALRYRAALLFRILCGIWFPPLYHLLRRGGTEWRPTRKRRLHTVLHTFHSSTEQCRANIPEPAWVKREAWLCQKDIQL